MLVKVSDNFAGNFGWVSPLGYPKAKTREDEPFEVAADVANRLISRGVLVAVEKTAKQEAEPVIAEAEPITVGQIAEAEKDIASMSWAELKAAATERGIRWTGKNKETVRKLIEEFDAAEAPEISAEDPV